MLVAALLVAATQLGVVGCGSPARPPGGGGGGGDGGVITGQLPLPRPPGTASLCGHGTFSGADVAARCQAPGECIARGKYGSRCDAASATGGSYEVWCASNLTYFYVRFDGVRRSPELRSCHNSTSLTLADGVLSFTPGGSNVEGCSASTLAAIYRASGEKVMTLDPTEPRIVIAEAQTGAAGSGSARLLLLGDFIEATGFLPCAPAPFTIGGATMSW